MLLISHRGNIDGSDTRTENTVPQIVKAINKGFDVEVDVRFSNNEWYLGHDCAEHKTDVSFLNEYSDKLWCHAKNISALEKMLELNLHCFWHQDDYYTITSKGIIWAYPSYYTSTGILVMPSKEFLDTLNKPIYGICVDNPSLYI